MKINEDEILQTEVGHKTSLSLIFFPQAKKMVPYLKKDSRNRLRT